MLKYPSVVLPLFPLQSNTSSSRGSSTCRGDIQQWKTIRTSILGGETLRVVEVSGDGDDGLLDLLANLGLGDLLHLGEDHGGNLLGGELLGLAEVVDLDEGGAVLVNDGERPVLHVLLDVRVIVSATDETLGVEDGLLGVHGSLVLGGITNETFALGESDVRGGGAVTLVVGNDFDTLIDPPTDTRVGGTKVYWRTKQPRKLDERSVSTRSTWKLNAKQCKTPRRRQRVACLEEHDETGRPWTLAVLQSVSAELGEACNAMQCAG